MLIAEYTVTIADKVYWYSIVGTGASDYEIYLSDYSGQPQVEDVIYKILQRASQDLKRILSGECILQGDHLILPGNQGTEPTLLRPVVY